jgi:hypothetical protein
MHHRKMLMVSQDLRRSKPNNGQARDSFALIEFNVHLGTMIEVSFDGAKN